MMFGPASRRAAALARLGSAEARRRPGRILVTLSAAILGAAALTTALTLGASAQRAVDHGLRVEVNGVDIVQRSALNTAQDSAAVGSTSTAIPQRDIRRVAGLSEVASVGTTVQATAVAQAGSSTLGLAVESLNTHPAFRWQTVSAGRAPQGSDEIALSTYTLDQLGIRLGDSLALGRPGIPTQLYRVVGVVDTHGSVDRLRSAYGIVTTAVAETLAGVDGPNTVTIAARPGADLSALVDDINRVAPVGFPQRTDEIIDAKRALQSREIDTVGSVVSALAGVSSVVAALIAATTAGANLATRRRVWALARCIGATRAQVGALVAVESTLLGLGGATIGVILGLGTARLLLPAVGLVPGLPPIDGSSFVIRQAAVVLPIVLGTGLALLSAAIPTWSASRIAPSAALKAAMATPTRSTNTRTVVAATLAVGGALIALHEAGSHAPAATAAGVAVATIGSAFLLSPVMKVIAQSLAWRSRVVHRRLGLLDVVRKPQLAVIEAVAVSLAVGMIVLSWVALSSVQAATSARLSDSDLPDLTVGAVAGAAPIGDATLTALTGVEGVESASGVTFGRNVTISGRGQDGRVRISIGTAALDEQAMQRALPHGSPVSEVRDDSIYLPTSAYPRSRPAATSRSLGRTATPAI